MSRDKVNKFYPNILFSLKHLIENLALPGGAHLPRLYGMQSCICESVRTFNFKYEGDILSKARPNEASL